MGMNKTKVAVLFGGQSVEHDVSILTGLQIIEAMDSTKYEPLPIYIDRDGRWWHGVELLQRKNYHFSKATKDKLKQVELSIGEDFGDKPFFKIKNKFVFAKPKRLYFDIAFFAFHGEIGEDGRLQGVFETARIPYVGPRVLAASVFMNKSIAKAVFRNHNISVLPEVVIKKPSTEDFIDIKKITQDLKISFPACVKPCNLGSSICVHKVENIEELHAALLVIFKVDQEAIIEPFVNNLVEYNIAVTKAFGDEITFSAIERPIRDGNLLSFHDKYLAQGGIDSKLSAPVSEGMASLSRELNPKLEPKQEQIIRDSAKKAFECVSGTGVSRIDFLCDAKTGVLWLNEVNPIPGSLAYFLWEACTPKIGFTALVDALIQEGFLEKRKLTRSIDLKSVNSVVFPERG